MSKGKLLQNPKDSNRLKLRPDVLSKLQQELKRLAKNDAPQVCRFVNSMLGRYPELRP